VRKISSLVIALALLVLGSTSAEAQRRLTGRVTGAGSNEPVNSAQILVVGTAIGTLTNDEGQFTLNVPSGPVTLRVRRVGYRSKDVPVAADAAEANVTLERDVLQLASPTSTRRTTSRSSPESSSTARPRPPSRTRSRARSPARRSTRTPAPRAAACRCASVA
jgi:hypothetical protein